MAKKNRSQPVKLTAPISDFIKRFEKLRYRHNAMTIYSDFLALSAINISNAVNPDKERAENYAQIISRYNSEECALFAEMFGCIVLELDNLSKGTPHYTDVLGELFHNLNLQDEWKGQFFTPQVVSDFMGLLTIGEHEPQIEKHGYIWMNEPCIGGGANVIGAVNAMFQHGLNPCQQLLVTGYDIDPRCVHMSYIQLSLMGVPAMLQQRNSLSLETYGDYWFTPIFVSEDWAFRIRLELAVDTVRKIFAVTEPSEEEPLETPKPFKPVQLTLF